MKSILLKFSILFFFLYTYQIASGQVRLIDRGTGVPIPYAQLISKGGLLVGISNIHGVVNLKNIRRFALADSDTIDIEHISYKNLKIRLDSLKNVDKIYLSENQILLPEIKIVPKTKAPTILVLKGYFRSYQLENNIPKYFTDGIVEYFIKPNERGLLRMKVLQHRSYRNVKLVKLVKNRTVTVSMVAAGVPYIYKSTILKELDKSYSIKKVSTFYDKICKDNASVGTIFLSKPLNRIQVNIDLIRPEKSKTHKLFNYISRITNIDITGNYSYEPLLSLTKEDLLSRKEFRRIYFKHKKDKKFTKIDIIDEFYVMKKWYITKSDFRKIKTLTNFALLKSSKYSDQYWKALTKYHIPKLSTNIKRLLGTTLTPYR